MNVERRTITSALLQLNETEKNQCFLLNKSV